MSGPAALAASRGLRSLTSRFARGGAPPLRAVLAAPPAQPRAFRTALVVEMGRRAAKIANRKGKEDQARAKLYGRVGKQIVAAVKAGGSSENSNATLAAVLQIARLNNIPKDLIERNIKRATDKSQADYTEARPLPQRVWHSAGDDDVTYEAYGLGGVGMVIEILTDNLNRAAMSVRSAVSKSGGKMADPGSVLFNFSRQGCVVLSGGAEDAVFAAATEAGAEDVLPRPGGEAGWEVTCAVADYGPVAAALKAAGLPMVGDLSGLRLVPLARVDVPDDEAFAANEALVDKLLELDDVDAVVSNQNDEE